MTALVTYVIELPEENTELGVGHKEAITNTLNAEGVDVDAVVVTAMQKKIGEIRAYESLDHDSQSFTLGSVTYGETGAALFKEADIAEPREIKATQSGGVLTTPAPTPVTDAPDDTTAATSSSTNLLASFTLLLTTFCFWV